MLYVPFATAAECLKEEDEEESIGVEGMSESPKSRDWLVTGFLPCCLVAPKNDPWRLSIRDAQWGFCLFFLLRSQPHALLLLPAWYLLFIYRVRSFHLPASRMAGVPGDLQPNNEPTLEISTCNH